MKTIYKILSVSVILALCSSCAMFEKDNYDVPSETLYGTIYDEFTGEPMQSGTGSMRIKLEELSWSETPTPQYFGNKQDGTYHNSMLFAGNYRVTAENGPFVPVEPVMLDIKGKVKHDFTVQPYLHLEITDVTLNGTEAVVKYKISSQLDLYKILDTRVFANITKFVDSGSTILDCCPDIMDLDNISNPLIYQMEHTYTIRNLQPGRTYYFRAAARVDDPIVKSYNYSAIQSIEVK